MSTTRKVRLVAKGFEMICPACGEGISEPRSGSYVWTSEDVATREAIDCSSCGEPLAVSHPKSAKTDF